LADALSPKLLLQGNVLVVESERKFCIEIGKQGEKIIAQTQVVAIMRT
jgi:hypothetical protein